MIRQEFRNGLPVLIETLHPEFECLEASLEKVNAVRRIDRPHDASQFAYVFQFFFRTHDHPSQEVIVTAEILGRRMQNIVNAILDGPQVVGRCEGGIDQRIHLMLFSNGGEAFQINHAKMWIRWRLGNQQAGIFVDRIFHGFVIAGLDLPSYNTETREVLGTKLSTPVVTLVEKNDLVALV